MKIFTDRIKELEKQLKISYEANRDLEDELEDRIEDIKNIKAGTDVSKISVNQFCDVLDSAIDRLGKGEILRFDTMLKLKALGVNSSDLLYFENRCKGR